MSKLIYPRLAGLLLFLAAATSSFSQNHPVKSPNVIKQFDEYATKVVNEWKIPGMSVGVIKDGKVELLRGYGVSEAGGAPLTEKSVFQIGSVSKSFTATIMAQLADEEKVKWDDTVKNILPDFRMYDKWVEENLQVKDIMIHRTGLRGQQGTYIPNLGYSRDDVYKMLPLLKPGYSFRGAYEYNNITFIIAQKIIEKVTGKSWEENLRSRILEPLGMSATSANGEAFAADPNSVTPHDYGYAKGKIVNDSTWTDSVKVSPLRGEEQALHWLTVVGPAGSVNSTSGDMLKYLQFHLNKGSVNGKQLITRKGMNYLHRGQTITSQDSTRTTLYGHCWFVEQNNRYRLWFHTGTTWGFTTLAAFVPELNLGLIVLVNSDASSNMRYALMRRLIDLYMGVPTKDYSKEYFEEWNKNSRESILKAAKSPAPEKLPAPELNMLAGTYDKGEIFGKAVIDIEGGEAYITVGPKGWRHKLSHVNGNEFAFRSDGHRFSVKFKTGPDASLDIDFDGGENFGEWKRIGTNNLKTK